MPIFLPFGAGEKLILPFLHFLIVTKKDEYLLLLIAYLKKDFESRRSFCS